MEIEANVDTNNTNCLHKIEMYLFICDTGVRFDLFTQVSPIIINTVITIQSALSPTAETPEELDSPIPVDLWEKRGWKELKLWFLEEDGDEDTASLAPLIPQGESLQVFSCIVTYCDTWLKAITLC